MSLEKELQQAAQTPPVEDMLFISGLRNKEFTRQSLSIYAEGLYSMARGFPLALASILTLCPRPNLRDHVIQNILEEEGYRGCADGTIVKHPEKAHIALLKPFMDELGVTPRADIVDREEKSAWFARSEQKGRFLGLSAYMMVGFEANTPLLYAQFIPILKQEYGFTDEQLIFFSEHMEADLEHGDRGIELIASEVSTPAQRREALDGAAKGARAFYLFHEQCARRMSMASTPVGMG